ncbi:Unknown protein, partial [Striga hermonthica]
RKKEARRRGLRWVDKGWWIPAEDCARLDGWDPWPEPTVAIADEKGDGDRLMGEWRASTHDARGWTEQDDTRGSAVDEWASYAGGTSEVRDDSAGEAGAVGMHETGACLCT